MGFKALFIGINEYTDLAVDNLEGARLDARALHALFGDSVVGIDGRLLVDSEATLAGVEQALDQVLSGAGPDDTVVVTFSGHGSADLGLMLHDSMVSSPDSMLSMSRLATKFQRTRAQNLLVLLDCCESGEGPRQVLLSWADTRELDEALHSPGGGGRVILAAANPLQTAWESGVVKGHGLLTASLMDVLLSAEGATDVRAVEAVVAERVRGEAARLGADQNTVGFSVIAGTFTVPQLRPGALYHAAFPDRSGSQVLGSFLELESLGIPRSVADVWAAAYPGGLNDLQKEAINTYRLLNGQSLLVVAPTSSGKTLLGEMAALQAVAKGRRAVFLVPYRALASEQLETFSSRYGAALGLRVIRCTGDYGDDIPQFVRGKYDIAVLTYEMFLSVALQNPNSLTHVGALVVDEAHFIADEERGITLELLLTLVVAERSARPVQQIVALSAVIGKINHFDDWLGAKSIVNTVRPVPLVEGVIDRAGVFQYLDEQGNEGTEQVLPRFGVTQRGDKPSAQDLIVPLAKTILANERETMLIFRGQKGNSAGCAGYLARELGLPHAVQAIEALPTVSASSDSARLRSCLERGTAFHNANLVREEKAAVEKAFRGARELRVLVATTTLAAGVNTPATTVLIVEHEFPGRPPRPFTVAEYKNMAGRAGRPGFAAAGRSMLYAENAIRRQQLFREYVRGTPAGVQSSFAESEIDTWLIRLLRQVKRIEADKAVTLLANTFGGYTLARRDATWIGRTERSLDARIARMRSLKLIEDFRGKLSLTLLGEACGQSSLSLDSCMHLVEMLTDNPGIDVRGLMVLTQCLGEASSTYVPLQTTKSGNGKDYVWSGILAGTLDRGVARELSRGVGNDDYQRRCKRVAILLDWVAGHAMQRLEQRFTTNPFLAVTLGTIQGIAGATRFHLRSAADVARVVLPQQLPEEETSQLLEQLERGLPPNLCEVARKVPALMREEIIMLGAAGFASVTALSDAPEESLRAVLATEARIDLLTTAGVRTRADRQRPDS